MSDKDKNPDRYEDAVWQYLIDHARVTYDGKFHIRFIIYNKKDFFNRVTSRYRGFSKKDPAKMETKRRAALKTYKEKDKSWRIRKFLKKVLHRIIGVLLWVKRRL